VVSLTIGWTTEKIINKMVIDGEFVCLLAFERERMKKCWMRKEEFRRTRGQSSLDGLGVLSSKL